MKVGIETQIAIYVESDEVARNVSIHFCQFAILPLPTSNDRQRYNWHDDKEVTS